MKRQSPVLVIVAWIIGLCQGLMLPPPTGLFNVGSRTYVFPKTTLHDPVAPSGTGTFVLLNVYYPTEQKASPKKYVWDRLSNLYDTFHGFPNGTFGNITTPLSHNAKPLPLKKWNELQLPTLVFQPGFAGPPTRMFHALLSDLASHGYSVVALDHPHEAPYIQLPDGTGITGLPFNFQVGNSTERLKLVQRVHDYRLTDASAVLDAMPSISKRLSIPLNSTHFSFLGHSLGGSAALSQILHERNRTSATKHRIVGALNTDGSLWAPVSAKNSSVDLRIPNLLISSGVHKGDPLFAAFDKQQSGWTKEINIGGKSNHSDFSDLIVMRQGLGIAGGQGAVTAERMIMIVRTVVRNFQNLLVGKGEGVLSGTDKVKKDWPELDWLYNATRPVSS